jgi:hypothetical protein
MFFDLLGNLKVAVQLVTGTQSCDRKRAAVVFKVVANVPVTAGTPVTVWTPAAGKSFRLLGWCLRAGAASDVKFLDQGTDIVRCLAPASTPAIMPELELGILSAAPGNALQLDLVTGTAITVSGTVFGTEE